MFVVLSGDAFALSSCTFIATSSPEKKIAYKLLPFDNYCEFAVLSGPDFIANLSDGL